MASQSPPDQDDVRPIRRESSTIQRLGKKARTLTIGSAHAKEVPEEDEVRQESYPIYHLRWEQKLKPFLEKRYPELKARYENKDVSNDKYWFAIPISLTQEEVEKLKLEIGKLKDKKPKKEKRADSPERQQGA